MLGLHCAGAKPSRMGLECWPSGGAIACFAAACTSGAHPEIRQTMPAPTISAASYDRSCASVADCAVVTEGRVGCCRIGCPNAVVSQTALTAFMSELATSMKIACGGTNIGCDGGGPFTDGCQQGRIACQDGACVLEMPGADGAAGD
jgi:hypothetical protein